MPEKDPESRIVVRSRKLPYKYQGKCTWKQYISQPPYADQVLADTSSVIEFSGTQTTESEGHRWPPRKRGGLQDIGGDFFSQKRFVEGGLVPSSFRISVPYNVDLGWYNVGEFSGFLLPMNPSSPYFSFPPSGHSSNDDLDEHGAQLISQCKPTNSPASFSTALGEVLHDGLPSVLGSAFWRDRTYRAKSVGDEYLNVQFGWKPLISDIRNIAGAISNSSRLLAQYERDAGSVVRRQRRVSSKTTSSEEVVANGVSAYVPNAGSIAYQNGIVGNLIRVRETTQSRWFSGAFTYYLPTDYDSRNRLMRLGAKSKVLLRADLTPETLWNLAPWSWAIDWFSDTGDVISNLQDFGDGSLVMRYGYIMEHTSVRDTYRLTSAGLNPLLGEIAVPDLSLVTETKIRRAANPFGFGISWEALSPFQLAILNALGISRKR